MEKLPQQTPDLTQQNIDRIAELFPSAITETKDADGKIKKAINFTTLKQLLSADVVDGDECYEFTWVGKKQSIIEGNKPIRKTLRPAKDESKNWDTTENLYIEGDNLEVLKMLQNSYLNSVKMIYIDPPYNTGNDFVYRDSFAVSKEDYEGDLGVYDNEDNRLFKNTETNGRYHSDWCCMMYPRLQLARNLLTDDGVIFISIDDNEVDNLRKICDEVFGEGNFVANVVWKHTQQSKNDERYFSRQYNYTLIYAKNLNVLPKFRFKRSEEDNKNYSNPDNDPKGEWRSGDVRSPNFRKTLCYNLIAPNGKIIKAPDNGWRWSEENIKEKINTGEIVFRNDGNSIIRKIYLSDQDGRTPENIWNGEEFGTTRHANAEIKDLFENVVFDTPKPTQLIKKMMSLFYNQNNFCVLDFFSGSSTTAHAVMQLNAEDGGNRKFIMVQLPEKTDEKSEAYKAGYKNICEIGKERIRRAGKKIEDELQAKSKDGGLFAEQEEIKKVDTGFRVLKLDDTNMKDVYYSAGDYSQQMLLDLESNIKEDRTDLDLLFGVMLDWGVPLSLPHITETIGGKKAHFVNDTDLVACFEENITETVVREIAKRKPLRVVFRDSSFGSSPEKINVSEIFKTLSGDTTIKVI